MLTGPTGIATNWPSSDVSFGLWAEAAMAWVLRTHRGKDLAPIARGQPLETGVQ
jgi:hypothetical protein